MTAREKREGTREGPFRRFQAGPGQGRFVHS